MATEKRVSPSQAKRTAEQGGIGTLADVSGGPVRMPEVEVGTVEVQGPAPQQQRMVEIRVNSDVDEMSWLAGNRRETYSFKEGHLYRVPDYIARELEAIGRLWH